MQADTDVILQQLAAISIEKCLLRLSRVSAGTWRLLGVEVSEGTLEEALKRLDIKRPVSSVYFNLKAGSALTMLMLFDHEDIECISKAFTGHSFPKGQRTTPAEEVMLLELGNIVLNALASSVLNALKKFSIPAVPQFMESDAASLVAEMGAAADAEPRSYVIKGALAIRSGECETTSEIFALVPKAMALEIGQAGQLQGGE